MKLYRGTQRKTPVGLQKVSSWTPSLAVAVVYSAQPGDAWSSRGSSAEFRSTSTVHMAELRDGAKVLALCGGENDCSFLRMMEQLEFGKPNGMTHEEGILILRLLHIRYIREVGWSGGPFNFIVLDDDGEPMDHSENVPFDIRRPQTLISWVVIDGFDDDPRAMAGNFILDTFALADIAIVRNIVRRLGYDALSYDDVFLGGKSAAPQLLGCQVGELDGVRTGWDLNSDRIPLHETVRPLNKDVLVDRQSVPTAEVLPQVQCAAPAANPRRRNTAQVSHGDLVQRLRF